MTEIILDGNGKVDPESELFKKLNEWHEKDEYSKIVEAVLAVPRENWSNKLWFRLISAYNNMREFDRAREELNKIEPFCDNPADLSRLHYMGGYIHYIQDREYLAIAEYRRGLDADPEDSVGLNLQGQIDNCRSDIQKRIEKLHSLAELINRETVQKCADRSEKRSLSQEEFTLYLGFLPAGRVIPGQEKALGFEYFKKYEGAEKQIVLDGLQSRFGFFDYDSFINFYKNSPYCNVTPFAEEVRAYIAGTSEVDREGMSADNRYLIDCYIEFINAFNEFLPQAGVLAWDISEKIGFLRWAYACDILTDADYSQVMQYLHDLAREKFSSFEEYILSLAFGAALFMFNVQRLNIVQAIDFLARNAPEIIGELSGLEW